VVTQNEKYRGGIITLRTRPHGPVAQPLPLFAGWSVPLILSRSLCRCLPGSQCHLSWCAAFIAAYRAV